VSGDDIRDLMMAVIHDDLAAFEEARATGLTFDDTEVAPYRSILSWAAEWGRTTIVELLLDAGAPHEPLALGVAAHKGHVETVRCLLGRGFDPNLPTDFPPLCAAADRCSIECVEALLEGGADPTLSTGPDHDRWSNRTALELALDRSWPPCEDVAALLRSVS